MNYRSSYGQFRAIAGITVGAFIFVAGLVLDPILSILASGRGESQIDAGFAYATLALVIAGLCILFANATSILTNRSIKEANEDGSSAFSTLSHVFSKRTYSRVLLLSAMVYGVFYALASGIIVYNPHVNFSAVYHASIPSSAVATCCSQIGQTPLAVVYLTEHVGLLLLPINLFLLFSMSWLVGLNAAIGTFLFSFRTSKVGIGWLGGIGSLIGLFMSCPTCAGLTVFSILGGTSALSLALFVGPLQVLLVAVSIPMLVASPIFLARSLRRNPVRACIIHSLDQ